MDLSSITIGAALAQVGYTPNFATDANLSDLGANVAATVNLASVGVSGGTLNAANLVYTALAAGPQVNAIVLYKNTGVAGTSSLIAYIDTGSGLPFNPNGGDVHI